MASWDVVFSNSTIFAAAQRYWASQQDALGRRGTAASALAPRSDSYAEAAPPVRRHPEDLLTAKEAVAENYFSSVQAAANLRWRCEGPAYSKRGKGKKAPVVYRRRDLDAWIDSRMHRTLDSEGLARRRGRTR